MKKYDVAAYIWPAYTGDEPRARIFWPDGIGEWQTVKAINYAVYNSSTSFNNYLTVLLAYFSDSTTPQASA